MLKTLTTNDAAQIVYSDEGNGRPVILVHGLGCRGAHWKFQKTALLAAGYRVIAPDLRFHGASSFTENGRRISRLGQDLRELFDSESLNEVTLVAHSMGVSVALAQISLYGMSSLSKIVFIDESPRITNDRDWNLGVWGVSWHSLEQQIAGETPWGAMHREPPAPEPMRELPRGTPFRGPVREQQGARHRSLRRGLER